MKRILQLAAGALLLSGCASTSTHEGMVYRDGSWYAPATDGRGDYYTASPRPYYGSAYDYPFDFSVGLVPFGGYCSVAYRWCAYGPYYYDLYWYQPWVYYQRPRHARHREDSFVGLEPDDGTQPLSPTRQTRERSWPDSRTERPIREPRTRGGSEGRRRRGGMGGGNLDGEG
jgi:hypothetical protein